MRNAFLAILTVFVLALGTPVKARSLEDGLKAYDAGDFSTAFEILLPFAERGKASAQYSLGMMYDFGLGVSQDYAEARRWLLMAAKQDYSNAQFNLGLHYTQDKDIPRNYSTAYMWLKIAIVNGASDDLGIFPLISAQMTPAQFAQAQARAGKCFTSNYEDCD